MHDASSQTDAIGQAAGGWRLKLGVAIFLFSIILPVAGVPIVSSFDLSTTMTATFSGALLVTAEILGVLAIAVMGKSGFAFIKNSVFGFLKQYGPPDRVSRLRYTVGLVMFGIPLLFALMSGYIADHIPGLTQNPLPYAIAGDITLIFSLFVLGGDFWDKVQALFLYDAKVVVDEEPD
jgi:hypothetical protein